MPSGDEPPPLSRFVPLHKAGSPVIIECWVPSQTVELGLESVLHPAEALRGSDPSVNEFTKSGNGSDAPASTTRTLMSGFGLA